MLAGKNCCFPISVALKCHNNYLLPSLLYKSEGTILSVCNTSWKMPLKNDKNWLIENDRNSGNLPFVSVRNRFRLKQQQSCNPTLQIPVEMELKTKVPTRYNISTNAAAVVGVSGCSTLQANGGKI